MFVSLITITSSCLLGLVIVSQILSSSIELHRLEACSFGTSCQFTMIDQVCTLTVDNHTSIINKTTASGTTLQACFHNTTLTCYYAKVSDSKGNKLGDFYMDNCESAYEGHLIGELTVNGTLCGFILLIGLSGFVIYKLNKNKIKNSNDV